MAIFKHDVLVLGAGVAGLWTAAVLRRAGYDVTVIDEGPAGGTQTLASQGMIHGGQKYALDAGDAAAAAAVAALPARWQDCFDGCGDLDLTAVAFTAEEQVMWPAGGVIAGAAVFAAAKAVNAGTRKMARDEYPEALSHLQARRFKGSVWRLPEKAIDVKSLIEALKKPLSGRVFQGEVTKILPDGQVAVRCADGKIHALRARVVIAAAGAGNEKLLSLMNIRETVTQRRPLRQVMVRGVPFALTGHGVTTSPKPRVTITTHRHPDGDLVWYLGGGIAEAGAKMTDDETLAFAKTEMAEMFPGIDWSATRWATRAVDRAEALDPTGRLPPGPRLHQRGQILIVWPSKLTFAPLLGDRILAWLKEREIAPAGFENALPPLLAARLGLYPWEDADWRTT